MKSPTVAPCRNIFNKEIILPSAAYIYSSGDIGKLLAKNQQFRRTTPSSAEIQCKLSLLEI